ncbi:MAG: CotH kinase family protein [Bacteroidales bacterium]|nr:CotH kinase family protein [Bacteroidales bacterium]
MTNALSTLFFRKLMENETFKTQFISRFYQLLNGAFKYENLKPIYDNAISQIAEEIQRQAYRFDNPKMEMDWMESVSIIDRFLAQRNSYFDNILFSDFAQPNQSLEITSIAPNPAKDHLHIHVDADEMVIADIQIFNILGQKLVQTKTILVKGGNEIDFPIDLNGGFFILRIGNASGKFIVIN